MNTNGDSFAGFAYVQVVLKLQRLATCVRNTAKLETELKHFTTFGEV
jgi:hypothetical protein